MSLLHCKRSSLPIQNYSFLIQIFSFLIQIFSFLIQISSSFTHVGVVDPTVVAVTGEVSQRVARVPEHITHDEAWSLGLELQAISQKYSESHECMLVIVCVYYRRADVYSICFNVPDA